MTIPVVNINDDEAEGAKNGVKTITLEDDRGFFMEDGKPWCAQKKENGDSTPDAHSDSSNHNEPHSWNMGTEKMKVIAQKGSEVFLIKVDDADDSPTAKGIIANTFTNERFSPRPIGTIAAQGYWEECEHSDELLQRLMAIPEAK